MSTDNVNKVKLQAWISKDLWEQIEARGYESKTQAVIDAFEGMLGQRENNDVSNSDQIDQTEIKVLKTQVEAQSKSLEDKEKIIEILENNLKKAEQDKEDIKQIHNNYFLQIQTLINQKAIGSPAESREIVNHVRPESPTESQRVSQDEPGEGKILKTCKYCGKEFQAENPRKEHCSPSCRSSYSRKMKKEKV